MFIILNKDSQVVDTATSLHDAYNVVTYLTGADRENAPFHCTKA